MAILGLNVHRYIVLHDICHASFRPGTSTLPLCCCASRPACRHHLLYSASVKHLLLGLRTLLVIECPSFPVTYVSLFAHLCEICPQCRKFRFDISYHFPFGNRGRYKIDGEGLEAWERLDSKIGSGQSSARGHTYMALSFLFVGPCFFFHSDSSALYFIP